MSNEIKKLFENTKNSSSKWEKYFDIYENIFSKYKDKACTFVEIGVHNGGSLGIWRQYFSKNSKIIGIDINNECKKFEDKENNIEIFIGNQSDENFWKFFFEKVGKVDIILDDGGHTNLNQIITTACTIKNINDGGVLLIEDAHTSYMPHYNSQIKQSFINFSKKIIDDINFKNQANLGKFNFALNEHVNSIQFFESIVVFFVDRKKTKMNAMVKNEGKDHNVEDLTWEGNSINIETFKKFLDKIPFFSFKKFMKKQANKTNIKYLKKYFK